LNDFLQHLRQRKLVQWALAYVAASFALIQVLDIVAQQFGWPDGVRRGITIALIVGFFVMLVLAWYHGEKGAQRVSGIELLFLALVLMIGGGLLWWVAPGANKADAVAPKAAVAAMAATLQIPAKSIAVLPFENLSDDKANAYFAEGMQDEILTRLAGIADFKVISRTSTKRYESHPENLRIVAAELGAAHILEGSVQKAGDAVRVNVQLIDARSDTHVWAQTFDREIKNVFVVESEVAQQIADVLKARLSPEEASALAKAPTRNAAAYDSFLKAEYAVHKAIATLEQTDYQSADREYRQAIALDPDFALAYARLAYSQMGQHWNLKPFTAAQLADVKSSVDRALALAPDLAEAHLALGYYHYWGYRHYDEATAQFERALQLAPSNFQGTTALGFIHRRKGEWPQALAALEKAIQIAPRDANTIGEYGITYTLLRRYPEAETQLTRALAVDPDVTNAKDFLLMGRLFGRGDLAGARAAFEPPAPWRIPANTSTGGDVIYLINPRVYADVFERHFDVAIKAWDSAPIASDDDRIARRAALIAIKVIAGERQSVQSECQQLKPLIDAQLTGSPTSLALLQQASWVDVCLGLNTEAIATARRAVDLLPISKDAYYGPYQAEGLAEIDAHAGNPDEALKIIEQLLVIPAGASTTIERLKRDPLWDPLRGDPRFAQLIARHTELAAQP
jgi:TolB-like protein/Tfp pilus assembly protein PilF